MTFPKMHSEMTADELKVEIAKDRSRMSAETNPATRRLMREDLNYLLALLEAKS